LVNTEEFRDAIFLIFANKQDLPTAMSAAEIEDKLHIHSIKQPYHVQACCATSGDGLYEGLEWLSQMIEVEQN